MINIQKTNAANVLLIMGCMFMLFVQFGHLHIHNHDLDESGAPKVHVLGGAGHQNKHDQAGEIDLQFESLIAKFNLMPDLLPLILFVAFIFTILAFRIKRYESAIVFAKSAVFSLRPPARASP